MKSPPQVVLCGLLISLFSCPFLISLLHPSVCDLKIYVLIHKMHMEERGSLQEEIPSQGGRLFCLQHSWCDNIQHYKFDLMAQCSKSTMSHCCVVSCRLYKCWKPEIFINTQTSRVEKWNRKQNMTKIRYCWQEMKRIDPTLPSIPMFIHINTN